MTPEERQNLFMAALASKPCIFISDGDPTEPLAGTGYWHADNREGVISYHRAANGQYDRNSRVDYPNDLIDTLNKAKELP